VFRSAEWAKGESVVFNYEEDDKGVILPNYESFKLLPDSFFYANEDLDYAIVRVENNPGEKYGFIDISKPGRKTLDTRVNIVQHPKAGPKKIAIRENGLKLWDREKNIIQYYTDTEHGSSGSPVFNDTWDIIGLHCRYNKSNEDKGEKYYNEAYTIDSIRTDIMNKYPDLLPKTQP
jgi:endonuclease G